LEGVADKQKRGISATFLATILQIMVLNIVFSLDSVIAIIIAVCMIMVSAGSHLGFRRGASDGEDARIEFSPAGRDVAVSGGIRPTHPEGIHVLRDVFLGLRRDRTTTHSLLSKTLYNNPLRVYI